MPEELPKTGLFRSRNFLLLCVLPVLAIGVLAVLFVTGRQSLDSKLAEMREQGLPTNWSELDEYYAVPEGIADRSQAWQKVFDLLENAELGRSGQPLPFLGIGETPIPPPGEEWDQFEASQKFLAENENILEAIYEASSESGQLRSPLDFNAGNPFLLTMREQPRTAARLLSLDAHTSTHQGNSDRALKDVHSIFELSNALRGEVILIHQLTRIAIQANGISLLQDLIAHNDWNDNQLESLQAVILEANFRDELIFCFHGDCAWDLEMMDMIAISPFRAANKMEMIRLMENTVDQLEESWIVSIESQKELSAEMAVKKGNAINMVRLQAVFLLAPAYEQFVLLGAEAVSRQRCVYAALAAKRHKLRHGSFPDSLKEIDQDLIGPDEQVEQLLTDPFDGQPLKWLNEKEEILVYSLGKDLKDDGGSIKEIGEQPATDTGFSIRK